MKILHGLTNYVLFAIGLAHLGFGTFATFTFQPGSAATALTAGLVFLFGATIDRFESLKAIGIEAKTRKLDNKINEADRALERLKEMTELSCAALIDLQSKIGRWNSHPSPAQLIDFAEKVRHTMESLGSSKETIDEVLEPWAKVMCFDVVAKYQQRIHKLLREQQTKLRKLKDQIPRPLNPNNAEFLQLNARINLIESFIGGMRRDLEEFRLSDYPAKFLELFVDVPEVDQNAVRQIEQLANRLIPGMRSLAENRRLEDTELWISEISKKEEE